MKATCVLVAIMAVMMGSSSAIKPILLTKTVPPAGTGDCQHTYLTIDKSNLHTFFPVMVKDNIKEEIAGTVGSVQIKTDFGAVLAEALVPMTFQQNDRFELQLKRPKTDVAKLSVEIMYEVIVDGRFCTKYRKKVKPDGSSGESPIYFCTI
ncbi:unnamed protein product [Bursaphelenchus xylophilus]|uniref:(pine wood nematode) hypothetical protein n=1 Tax=Bursaphelenchus xylophilus TaxID=6326 RepID=A0A1I7S6M4_BURXY|nr:unnamed protein product [Bursaphelenchus xylophilus]CAG9120574.1 unnamed protein product [Bursaphelenchus xylophilus]